MCFRNLVRFTLEVESWLFAWPLGVSGNTLFGLETFKRFRLNRPRNCLFEFDF
eukprot:TRINITY_DN10142_c0_g1_i1.p1 TRINITY_DN10142_c0_g1~~TRINITY_DN10142_c0_g1_i1.p1  ORF type:complete len:53 (-),score=2.04 TRINITY_DN10142_c0_g1_i1:164-322(-)